MLLELNLEKPTIFPFRRHILVTWDTAVLLSFLLSSFQAQLTSCISSGLSRVMVTNPFRNKSPIRLGKNSAAGQWSLNSMILPDLTMQIPCGVPTCNMATENSLLSNSTKRLCTHHWTHHVLCTALTDHTEAMLYVLWDTIRPQHHRKSWEKVVRNKETLKFSYLTVKNKNRHQNLQISGGQPQINK